MDYRLCANKGCFYFSSSLKKCNRLFQAAFDYTALIMKNFFKQLLQSILLFALWLMLLWPCYRICLYWASEDYARQSTVHEWFSVAVYDDENHKTVRHPNDLTPQSRLVQQTFNTGMGFYLQKGENGIYEAGNEIGFGIAQSRYQIENNRVYPISFVYLGMHNVLLPCAVLAAVLTSLIHKLWAYRRKRQAA